MTARDTHAPPTRATGMFRPTTRRAALRTTVSTAVGVAGAGYVRPAVRPLGVPSALAVSGPTDTPPPISTPALPFDTFDDNRLDTSLWTTQIVGSGVGLAETNGRLEMTLAASASDDPAVGAFSATYVSRFRLRGDLDIAVEYQLLEWPASNGARLGLQLSYDVPNGLASNNLGVGRASLGSSADFPGYPREIYSADLGSGVQGITVTTDMSGALRIMRTGSTVFAYRRAGGDWVQVASGQVPPADMLVTVSAWSHSYVFARQLVRAAFDNFAVRYGTAV